jgi:hypothetical protein
MDAPSSLVRASAQIQFDAAPAATDELTIGAIVYTYIASPAAAYDVDVGTDLTESVVNLSLAINSTGTGSATTYYDTGTLANPNMYAAIADTDQILLTARIPGTVGNGIYLLSAETDLDFEEVGDTATLFSTAGTGVFDDAFDSLIDEVQINSEALSLMVHISSRSSD